MTAPHKLEFDVASVRKSKSGGEATSNFPLIAEMDLNLSPGPEL
jgi:hypothetical protein